MSSNFQRVQRATYSFIDMWLENFAKNLQYFSKENSIRELNVFLKNNISLKNHKPKKPVVVIGGGPSVSEKNHLEQLLESNFDGTIVCTDRMLIKALKKGISPERFPNFYAITIDGVEHVSNLYDDPIVEKFSDKINVCLTTCCSPKVVEVCTKRKLKRFWFNPLIDDFRKKESFSHIMNVMSKSEINPKGLLGIQTGGDVGTSSWIFSWAILGHSPIALIGINFGYPGETRLEDTLHYENLLTDHEKPELVKDDFKIVYNEEFDCKALLDPVFNFYREGFLDLVSRTPSWVKTINSTEGGSLFGERIECKKFSDFLNEQKN